MRETGVVYKVRGSLATVRFDRKTACENCNMCLKPREANYVELKLKNEQNAAVGDRVEVVMGDRAVLTAATLVYAVPLIVMGIALALTYKLSIGICLGVSFGALLAAFVAVACIDRFVVRKRPDYMPRMVRIVREEAHAANAEESASDEKDEISETTPDSLD